MKHTVKHILSFVVLAILSVSVLTGQINVMKFGARGNGITPDTRYIQKAIDEAFENGGGTVEVPSGKFLIGTIILKDNVELHLQPGALLLGSPDYRDYAEIIHKYDSRTNGLYAKHFMLFADGAKNISITGTGTIHGNGLEHFLEDDPQNLRPFMIRLVNCENVTVRDVKLLESANWTFHLLGCRDVSIDGISIENHNDANRDGLDIDACNRVTVSGSRFLTGDDAIVMKASNDTLCQNISITNCIIRTNASAIKTGTESNGGFRNITVSNCVIKDLPRHAGIELMTVDGGIMQNIVIDNITMENVATPVFIRLGNRARPYKPGQYVDHRYDAKDIYLNNITVLNAKLPSSIIGMNAGPVQNIVVTNYSVRSCAAQVPVPYNMVPFEEFSYPAANVFRNLPAYGFYCRNVEGLRMDNITAFSSENELRPAFVFDKVNGLDFSSVRAEINSYETPLAYFRNSSDAVISYCKTAVPTGSLFVQEGNSCTGFHLSGNILHSGQAEIRNVPSMKEQGIFEDFNTDIKYIVQGDRIIKSLASHDIKKSPLKFSMNINKRGSLQLCLLMLNNSVKPSRVKVKYEGIVQEYEISWNEWGWAPLTLTHEYQADKNVDFEISGFDKSSDLEISRACLRYQDVKKTD